MSAADDVLDNALRIHMNYRRAIAALLVPLEDDDVEKVHNYFSATNLMAINPSAGLVASDIRIACKREKDRRVKAAAQQEAGS